MVEVAINGLCSEIPLGSLSSFLLATVVRGAFPRLEGERERKERERERERKEERGNADVIGRDSFFSKTEKVCVKYEKCNSFLLSPKMYCNCKCKN